MKPPVKTTPLSAADVLAVLSQNATRRGDTALGCTRLIECMKLLQSTSGQSGAAALEAAADLAAAAGQPERAVEFYGACERILRRVPTPKDPVAAEHREKALGQLRGELGLARFEAAWNASRPMPYPLEFYLSAALDWLEGLEPTVLPRPELGSAPGSDDPVNPGSTAVLIAQVRDGNHRARERLAGRYLEVLRRFGRGRLPNKARDLMDTDDLVQVTVLRALEKVHSVDADKKGNFLAYMRKILINKVRDEIRRSSKKPEVTTLSDTIPSNAASPLEETLERESLAAYYRALSRISPRQREALTLRIEHGFSYQQVAEEVGCPSANAARMVIVRSLVSVTKQLRKS